MTPVQFFEEVSQAVGQQHGLFLFDHEGNRLRPAAALQKESSLSGNTDSADSQVISRIQINLMSHE